MRILARLRDWLTPRWKKDVRGEVAAMDRYLETSQRIVREDAERCDRLRAMLDSGEITFMEYLDAMRLGSSSFGPELEAAGRRAGFRPPESGAFSRGEERVARSEARR